MTPQVVAKIIAFVLYLGFMIYIGLRNANNNNNSADFFLGGGKVGPWVTALSAEASDSFCGIGYAQYRYTVTFVEKSTGVAYEKIK